MKSTQNKTPKTVKKAAPKLDLISQDTFLDLQIHQKKVRPEQRNELKAWFDHNKLNTAIKSDFQKLLASY